VVEKKGLSGCDAGPLKAKTISLAQNSAFASQSQLADIEEAVRAGALWALRKRAAVQRAKAADGTVSAGERFPGIMLRSPEAAVAASLAAGLDAAADELEREARL